MADLMWSAVRAKWLGAANKAKSLGPQHADTRATWSRMFVRCTDPSFIEFDCYGGRGISVCARWGGENGFQNFLADMGLRPSKDHSLDRIDNDGNYYPENCKWSTRQEQSRNRSTTRTITANGISKCLAEWSIETGIHTSTIFNRIRLGWTPEEAVGVPRVRRK